ncbi:uncharacterized protein PRCAT00003866001 [Priceomyces carsonii]|uniref:uncharacterized protein n=1 Tax=Priceomyces carsonii TaxID=28549 RepID=UPI002ED7C702|nr:unnamed protein product [Priceomyces carsonii]
MLLSLRDKLSDSDFDDFFADPFGFNTGRSQGDGTLVPLFGGFGEDSLVPKDKLFLGFSDNLDVKEEPDKYVLSLKGALLEGTNYKVDYVKDKNELVVSTVRNVTHKDDHGSSSTHSSSQRTVKFDKPIKFDSVKADTTNGGLLVTAPKVKADK